ncbi:uncharacterized protein HGUI_01710 [Hanseniaspora guilliermondii]|uniref:Uncharacterized protein n=1 Tax=Hanseniaspora guilliermondii TaxID=56406 RepID=A0A1L0FIS8_9ASCO|nr:uncharacterized protein HGUI_01710 [Hanseniaspora guilliermondii]
MILKNMILQLYVFTKVISAHGNHDIHDTLEASKEVLTKDFKPINKMITKLDNATVLKNFYQLVNENYFYSTVGFNLLFVSLLALLLRFISIKSILSKLKNKLNKNYTSFMNKYGYLKDFEYDDKLLEDKNHFNIIGLVMNFLKVEIFDDFDFENFFNFFILTGFIKELFLELFYALFIHVINMNTKKTDKIRLLNLDGVFGWLAKFKLMQVAPTSKSAELLNKNTINNVAVLTKKIMFSYASFYIFDRLLNITLMKIFGFNSEHVHSHESGDFERSEVEDFLHFIDQRLKENDDIKSVGIELDIDNEGNIIRSFSATTFQDDEAEVNSEEDESEEDDEFMVDNEEDMVIEIPKYNNSRNIENIKFIILNVVNDFVLNINSGISLYSIFEKQSIQDYKKFLAVWSIQHSFHVLIDSVYMINKATPLQFTIQLLLSNLGTLLGIFIKHSSKLNKSIPIPKIISETSHLKSIYSRDQTWANFFCSLFDIKRKYGPIETTVSSNFYTNFLDSLKTVDYDLFLLTFQIGFTMFLVFNKILPETKQPNSIKKLLMTAGIVYLGYISKV